MWSKMSKKSNAFPDEFQNMKGLPLWKCRFRWGRCRQTQPLLPQCKSDLVSDCKSDNVPSWFPLLNRLPEFWSLHVRGCLWEHLWRCWVKGTQAVSWVLPFSKASLTTVLCNVMILPLGTTPEITHPLFGCQVLTKQGFCPGTEQGTPKSLFS